MGREEWGKLVREGFCAGQNDQLGPVCLRCFRALCLRRACVLRAGCVRVASVLFMSYSRVARVPLGLVLRPLLLVFACVLLASCLCVLLMFCVCFASDLLTCRLRFACFWGGVRRRGCRGEGWGGARYDGVGWGEVLRGGWK